MATTKEAEQPKREAAKKPGPNDVHEQREPNQKQEGAVAPKLASTEGDDPTPRRSGAV